MDPLLAAAVGTLFAALVAAHPAWREQFGKRYDDDREYFRARRPRLWTFVDAVDAARSAVPADPDGQVRCPACGADNESRFDHCGNCGARLPTIEQ
ncbi:MAG: zinc ribbon domain-containing protein [Halobacteriales archaeon]